MCLAHNHQCFYHTPYSCVLSTHKLVIISITLPPEVCLAHNIRFSIFTTLPSEVCLADTNYQCFHPSRCVLTCSMQCFHHTANLYTVCIPHYIKYERIYIKCTYNTYNRCALHEWYVGISCGHHASYALILLCNHTLFSHPYTHQIFYSDIHL